MNKLRIVCVPLIVIACGSTSWGQYQNQNRNSGLGIGAVMGAVTGGLIGDRNHEAVAGAAIGAAVGGLTGAVVGKSVDNEMAYREQRAGQRVVAQQMSRAVTVTDVISMSQSRLSDSVIITQIRTNGVAQQLQAPDLVALSNAGVSDNVIQAMQSAPLATAVVAPVAPVPVYQDRVIVEERYVVPNYPPPVWYHGYYYHPHPRYYHGPPPPPRPGVSWGFSFSN
jgi:hypothetical protein